VSAADTIVAIATPPGRGGVGIVRVSGPRVMDIARAIGVPDSALRSATLCALHDADGVCIDRGLALRFEAPHSFTGEHVLELHAHGSPVVLAQLVARCIELGARAARAGEFSERAYRHGKLDLAQAEAIADLIAAGSTAQARAALRSLEGGFSRQVTALLDALIRMRMYIEAAIDFPEEEVDFLADARLTAELDQLRQAIAQLLADARRGQRLRDGLHAVIVGPPNAGKSSLLNALAGSDRAIVTALPGTTRDVLRETLQFDGIELTLVDTAGLRDSDDRIEAEGMRRARAELIGADLALLVIDPHTTPQVLDALRAECAPQCARIIVANKSDLQPNAQSLVLIAGERGLRISALTGEGLDALRNILREHASGIDANTGTFSARARHVEALTRVAAHLDAADIALRSTRAGELAADDLRQAQQALAEITGEFSSDDLLGQIFGKFCIGK
jgi:tRNA modification GTPase